MNEGELGFSQMFDEIDNQEIEFSEVISFGTGADDKIDKEKLKELYKSCFENMEDINCRKNIDELLSQNILMNKENKIINDFKNKYNSEHKNNKLLVKDLYEQLQGKESIKLLPFYPKTKKNEKKMLIISNYIDNNEDEKNNKLIEDKKNEKDLVKEIITDFFDIKKLLNN